MSFNGYKDNINEGDAVILYLTISQVYSLKADTKVRNKNGIIVDNIFQTPYGSLKCADLIGKKFGSKIGLSKGWGYILQPTPELWTITLPHRTQIVYTPDISMIIMQLEIYPGSTVIESGTGSGSLSHALIRAIKPGGHLFTFDFHEVRAKTAEQEFHDHGLSEYVTVNCRDVCSSGFGDELNGKSDAVFLDLPHPWLGIAHSIKALKDTGGRICTFSPCIEQVQKTCLELVKLEFQEIQTIEVLQTQYNVHTRKTALLDLECLKTVRSENCEKVKQPPDTCKNVIVLPQTPQPGHTGYLTFATLYPNWARKIRINLNLCNNDENIS